MSVIWLNARAADTTDMTPAAEVVATFRAAKRSNHSRGLPWTDPISGETYPAPKRRKRVAVKPRKGRKGRKGRK
jgi:hypothetical protein